MELVLDMGDRDDPISVRGSHHLALAFAFVKRILWTSSFGPQPSSGSTLTTAPCVQLAALPLLSTMPKQEDCQPLEEFLQEDADMPSQQPTLVQAVTQSLKPEQAIEASLQRTWHVAANEPSRRTMAQPHWKTLLQQSTQQQQQQQPMPTLHESQHGTEESDSMPSPSLWSMPEGYQSLTSTQRNADAARDAQLEDERNLASQTISAEPAPSLHHSGTI